MAVAGHAYGIARAAPGIINKKLDFSIDQKFKRQYASQTNGTEF